METIYDVFRMLVQRSRMTMADSEVDQAIAIIDQAENARNPQPQADTEVTGG